jgi:hypothetical protein
LRGRAALLAQTAFELKDSHAGVGLRSRLLTPQELIEQDQSTCHRPHRPVDS